MNGFRKLGAEMGVDILACNNARKLGEQPDNSLAVNQNYTYKHNCNVTLCFMCDKL